MAGALTLTRPVLPHPCKAGKRSAPAVIHPLLASRFHRLFQSHARPVAGERKRGDHGYP